MNRPANNPNKLRYGLSAAILLLAGGLWLWQRPPAPAPQTQTAPPSAPETVSPQAPPAITNRPAVVPADKLHDALAAAKATTDAPAMRQQLAALRADIAAMPKDAAVASVRQFLDSKADAPTHLGFKVAANGLLDEAPTLRVFLLDELLRLDPAAAADYAKTLLGSADSPDEWALALRNLARGDESPAGRALLEQKTGEMLKNADWQQNPSVGYLEAFDTAVYLGGANLLPTLTDLVRKQDNPAVAHASFLALDRMVINDPTTTLAALQTSPDLMQGREQTRANYFARADVRDAQQRQVLENYLLNPQLNAAELSTFAGVYPNANFMISANLLTQNATPDHNSLVNRDAESLRIADEWLADPRFAKLRPQLEKMKLRLSGFVKQAAGQ